MSARAHVPLALAAGLLLGACAVGPNYERPAANPPASFRGASGSGASSDLAWWDVYRDPALTSLIRTALANGYDTKMAASRVLQARAIAAEAHGQLFPGVGYAGNADRGKNAVLGNAFPGGTATTADGFDAYLGAAWEFDLWGRVRRLDEAARAQYLASREAERGVRLSLESDVATAYYELLELDEELAIERRAAGSFGESLRLFNLQLKGGTASRLDSASAEGAMESSRARIPGLEMQIEQKENQISVLLGASPGPVARGAALSAEPEPPDIPAGLPSDLLERRPDVRQAEEAVRAANAGIGVTIGGFLPRIGLSAVLGGVSTQLDQITTHGSQLWSVGANVTGPLFQGGSLHGQYDAAKAQWEEAKIQYQQAALSAFSDVADALVARQKLAEALASQERAVRAYEEAVALSTERYKAGRASYYEVIQSQLLLFPAQVALAQTCRDRFLAVVRLYRALGGGWKAEDQAGAAGAK